MALAVVAPLWELATLQGTIITDDVYASDLMNNGLPERVAIGRALAHGEAPFWMNDIASGFPLLARAEAGAMAPWNLLLYGVLPPYVALNLSILLTMLLAAFGTAALARSLGASTIAAALAGFALAWSGFFVCHMKHLAMVNTAAWLPLGLFVLHRALQSGRGRAFLLVGVVSALQDLAGHVQIAYYSGLVYGAWFAAHMQRDRIRLIPWFVLALALGHAGGAIQLLPTWELVSMSGRAGGVGLTFAADYAYDPDNWKTFLVPYANGDMGNFTYTGKGIFWESYGYVGLLTFLLALHALVARWREPRIYGLAIGAAVAYLLVLGPNTPLFELAFALPGRSFFRFPTRFLLVVDLALCLLAALGMTHLLDVVARRMSAGAAAGLAAAIGVVIVGDLYFHQPRQNAIVKLDTWMQAPTILDHFAGENAPFRIYSPLADAKHTEAYRAADGWQGDLSPYVEQREFLQPNLNLLYEVDSANGYSPLTPRYMTDIWGDQENQGIVRANLRLANQGLTTPFLESTPAFHRLLGLFNVKYVLSGWPLSTQRSFDYLGRIGAVHLYRNPDALPRAFIVGKAHIAANDPESLSLLTSSRFDARHEVVLFEEPAVRLGGDHSASRAVVTGMGSNHVEVQVKAAAPGLLVLSDTWYPGWEASVNGAPTPVLRANHMLRAIVVPKGLHEVRFDFRSTSIALGASVSLVGLLGLAGAAWTLRKA
jgi:hypothetical protein